MKIRRNTLRILTLLTALASVDCVPPETKLLNNSVSFMFVGPLCRRNSEDKALSRVLHYGLESRILIVHQCRCTASSERQPLMTQNGSGPVIFPFLSTVPLIRGTPGKRLKFPADDISMVTGDPAGSPPKSLWT